MCTPGETCMATAGCCPAGTPVSMCQRALEMETSLSAMMRTRTHTQNIYYTSESSLWLG